MKTFASVALLATLVFISAEARPSEDDMIVEFAIGQSDSYSMLKVAELMEKYGKKLALVGRLISNLGDSITGLGRWLKNKQGAYTDVRPAIAHVAEELSKVELNSSEANIAAKILAATCKHVAENQEMSDSQLESYLSGSIAAISEKLSSAAAGAEVDTNDLDKAAEEFFDRFATDF